MRKPKKRYTVKGEAYPATPRNIDAMGFELPGYELTEAQKAKAKRRHEQRKKAEGTLWYPSRNGELPEHEMPKLDGILSVSAVAAASRAEESAKERDRRKITIKWRLFKLWHRLGRRLFPSPPRMFK